MAKGKALNIGLNSVDSDSYAGWDGTLNAPENDAVDLTSLANSQGFDVIKLVTAEATYENVIEQIKMGASLQDGDIFMLSFSGNGGTLPNNYESTFFDETICLYNRQMRDSEIFYLLTKFHEGVRVVLIFDKCHSGTVTGLQTSKSVRQPGFSYKFCPDRVLLKNYTKNKKKYDEEVERLPKTAQIRQRLKSSVILMRACRVSELAQDGDPNSLFISKFLDIWNGGSFHGSYKAFYETIANKMPSFQSPTYTLFGKHSQKFIREKPFTIRLQS